MYWHNREPRSFNHMTVWVNNQTYKDIVEITKLKSTFGNKVTLQDTMRLLLAIGIDKYKSHPEYKKYKFYSEEKEIYCKKGEEWSLANIISKIGTSNGENN